MQARKKTEKPGLAALMKGFLGTDPYKCGDRLRFAGTHPTELSSLTVDNLLYTAGKRGLDIGIFCAIHTYGRRLNWSPHVHVSVTCGGVDAHGKWKKISFRKDAMRTRWMWNIRQLLLSAWSEGVALPPSLSHITTESQWRSLILTAGAITGMCTCPKRRRVAKTP